MGPEKPEEPLKEKDKVRDEFAERDKKPKPEEEKIIITPAALPTKPEVKAPEPEAKAPELEPENLDGKTKDRVRDEFEEKNKKAKPEEEKIIIKPAVLSLKKKVESWEEESEEEEEEKPAKKKLSKADLKPAVQIKMATAPEPPISRRKKKEPEPEEAGSLFDGLPQAKPKVKDEFAEKDKKPKEEEKIVITPA